MEKQAAAKISSAPTSKPKAFQGKPTVGTPTLKELRIAKQENALKVNKRGYLTTPSTRFAAKELKHAKKAVGHSKPDLSGLSPQERRAAKLDVKIGPKYGIPPSVLMAQQRQESGFDPAAVSSAGAQGISQFIPSTAASYGVRYGTGQPEVRSQIRGQAELLKDQGFKSNPQAALSAYSGGYAASDYNNPILEGSSDYKALDSRDNPKAIKRLADAKTLARSLGLRAAGKAVKPPKKLITRFKAAKKAMKEVEGLPYVWGGGHGSPTSSPTGGGLDCSGAVGYVLNKIGALHGSLTSGSMGSVLKPGPGALTVFYNAGHTFLRLGNEYWGTSVGDSGSGGLGPHPTPSASYLAQYNVGHVPGMGMKQALELGFKNLGTPSSFPGMTLSPSGTTATIDPGAGATQGKPGFSSSPIQPTQQQKARRAIKKLSQLGVPTSPKAKEATKGVTLAELEKTYGPSAV
jgi:cell wall-associated NlpC family hydrolase